MGCHISRMKEEMVKMDEKYDFSGWATRANLKCSDGRTIKPDAFKNCDGMIVPLVWNHQHNDPTEVLGHALLKNRKEGVYTYGKFNDTESGQTAKMLVDNGDITSLSIYANQLKHDANRGVTHGMIREVSLVLAGANPGAYIDSVMQHGEECDDEGVFYSGLENAISLEHADEPEKKNEEDKKMADEPKTPETEETIADVFNTLNEKQKNVVYAMIGQALEDSGSNNEEDDDVKHNVFDNDNNEEVLSHAAMETIIADGKRYGSLKESFLAHADEYGIENIDYLFPEAKTLNTPPDFIKREMGWVQKVMSGTHHTPFSRIKSMFADITEDDARAKGYIKGNLKKEEVFSLLKRTTTPTTIYKKQKLDRDDVIDITDFDVVAWLKTEMRMMLDEEIARAILVGDGRLASSDDKINESNIRPIWKDEDLYNIKATINVAASASTDEKCKAFIRAAIKSRKNYKGSGTPTLFTTEDVLTDILLLEDNNGRIIYDTEEKLRTALRVKEIVTVPVMEGLTRTDSEGNTLNLMGIIVNLTDYNVGADKGGAINMFDDFDIDYNQQKYLIETRCSGALIKPFSAISLEMKVNPGA
nr:MAG TPA: major capsid protein [Bacteriophage sp.]